jgi:c-di-GMP-binding flagellar brake protein YcgR
LRTAVRAGVEEGVDLVLGVAGEQDGALGHAARDEVARLVQLGTVAEIEPAAIEDLRTLGIQYLRIDEAAARHLEQVVFLVDQDVGGTGHRIHDALQGVVIFI